MLESNRLHCAKCERPGRPSPFPDDDYVRCLCCNRPWIACPCSPATDGECEAIDDTLGYVFDPDQEPPYRHRRIGRRET